MIDDFESPLVSEASLCIAGMHRSGTSMVTRLLKDCGLFLGDEEELTGPALDNPEGFWENKNFVELNEEILARFGASWSHPQSLSPRWEFDPVVEPLLVRAGELVARFSQQRHWGWKDPRNSLTIAFWRRIIPSLKFVVCIRNPIEVAHSLFVRGDTTGASQFELWLHYYQQILSVGPPSSRIITHYQSYFEDPREEVGRLTSWLGLNVSNEALERACAGVSGALRHHHMTTSSLREANVPDEVVDLYLRLCEEAGPVCQRLLKREIETTYSPTNDAYALQLMRLENQMAKDRERISQLELRCASLEVNCDEQLRHLELQYTRLDARSHEVRASILPVMRALDALRALRNWLRSIGGGGSS